MGGSKELDKGYSKSLVMVLGAARSGTTMLDLMLGNASDVFSCGEVWALFRPHRAHHFEPHCLCGDPECDVWSELAATQESEFHSKALRQPGVRFVVDSSKDLRWLVDSHEWARRSGTRIINVVTWKDPLSLSYSHWKRGRPADHYRQAFIRYYGRFLGLGLPFISLSYRRLIEDAAQSLSDLCGSLGMKYASGREEFWRKRHHHLFGSAGTARQVSSGNSQLKLQTEYPWDFLREFELQQKKYRGDDEVMGLIAQLEAHELGSLQVPDVTEVRPGSGLKPAWYYYHWLKAFFRKRFPAAGPVAD